MTSPVAQPAQHPESGPEKTPTDRPEFAGGPSDMLWAWSARTSQPRISYHADGTVLYLNQACESLLGRSMQDVAQTQIVDYFGNEWFEAHHELALAAEPEDPNFNSQLVFVIDGMERLYQITTLVLHETEDTPWLACLTMQDISEDAHIRAELVKANQSLSESNRDLEEFAYVASHDLQEPLRKIQAFGDRLQSRLDGSEDEKALDYLERMQGAAGRMQVLISDLLSFSRVTTSGRDLAPVSLEDIVASVLSDLEVAVTDANATIHVGSLPSVEGDGPQLQQLMQNLLGNALKFRAPDRDLEIWIESVMIGSRWLVSVRDTGIGFDQEYAEKIFTVFQRLHGRSAYAGTGVGLAICRKIVERHGGTIRAQGEDGDGATFLIDLPRSLDELQAVA